MIKAAFLEYAGFITPIAPRMSGKSSNMKVCRVILPKDTNEYKKESMFANTRIIRFSWLRILSYLKSDTSNKISECNKYNIALVYTLCFVYWLRKKRALNSSDGIRMILMWMEDYFF